ncbi:MAG: glycosyltransferase [Elusimicrobia bacterium]|nr:glycosyltransferase [Elusimicrobiota bacterium]
MNKEFPLISVIIPVYNTAEYLPQCLDSLLQQTYSVIEIILLDNASIDGSSEICDKYATQDTRVKVVHFQENKGVSVRNYGIELAKGKYISFVDSDDFLDLNTYQTAIALLKHNPKTDAIRWGMRYVFSDGSIKLANSILTEKGILARTQIHSLLVNILQGQELHNMCLFLFSAELIHQHSIRLSQKLVQGEDLYFTVCYLLHSKQLYYLPNENFYNYRQNASSLSHQPCLQDIQRFFDTIQEMQLLLTEHTKNHNLVTAFNARFKKVNFTLLYKLASIQISIKQAKKILDELYQKTEIQNMILSSKQISDKWYKNLLFLLIEKKYYVLALVFMKLLIKARYILNGKYRNL